MAIELEMDPQSNDETPVELNEDQREFAIKEIKELYGVLSYLHDLVQQKQLTVSNRYTSTGLIESHAGRIVGATGIEGSIQKSQDARHSQMRAKNAEIRRLENLLGSTRGVNGVAESLSLCKKNFHNYWGQLGFSLVHDHPVLANRGETGGFSAGNGTMVYWASLSTMLNDRTYSFSDTPASDRRKRDEFYKSIREVLDLTGDARNIHDLKVLDTPKNRAYIEDKLMQQYPSLEIYSWNIQRLWRGEDTQERMQIRSLVIEISNVEEMLVPVGSVYEEG